MLNLFTPIYARLKLSRTIKIKISQRLKLNNNELFISTLWGYNKEPSKINTHYRTLILVWICSLKLRRLKFQNSKYKFQFSSI